MVVHRGSIKCSQLHCLMVYMENEMFTDLRQEPSLMLHLLLIPI
jgi:hypothetical protein